MKNLVLTDKNLYAMLDKAMWTDEASGAYTKYSSIAEEGTSLRRKSNAN